MNVLIVDDDESRASGTARLVRLWGAVPSTSRRLELAPDVDVIITDDDAFSGGGAEITRLAARISPMVFRCLCARWNRFVDVRGSADYVLVKPFTMAALSDVLRTAHARRHPPVVLT